jgi:outer membrane immunogenic protein
MRIRFVVVAGAACAAGLVSPAFAADLGGPRQAPIDRYEPAPVHSSRPGLWQGIYWGLSGGYGWGDSSISNATQDTDVGPEGWLASATVGYNYMVGQNFLIGIEGDLGFMNISNDDKSVNGSIYRTSFGPWWGTMRARAGLAFGRLMIYGTGGIAFAAVEEDVISASGTVSNDDVRSGWVAGGGLEWAFSESVSAKVEYLHMDFGGHSALSSNLDDYDFNNRIDVVRAGINFKF